MSQEPVPGRSSRAEGAGAWPRRVLVAAVVALSLVAASPLARYAAARHSAAPSGSIAVNLASGPAGTTTQLSGTGFPRQADLQGNQDVFTFDGNAIPFPAIVPCDTGAGFGFGQACSANSGVPFQIPTTAQPGPHTFHLQITETSPGTPPNVLVDASATFVVPAPPTATVAATDTPTPTPAAVATMTPTAPTSTPTPIAPTTTATPTATLPGATTTPLAASATSATTPTALVTAAATTTPTTAPPTANTPPTSATTLTPTTTPNATPTTTTTPAPLTATATPIPTAQPTAKSTTPFVAIVRPEFAHNVVAIALHTAPGAKIHIDFRITAVMGDGSVRQVFGTTRDGLTNALGVFAVNLKIGAPGRRPGKAVLTIRAVSGVGVQTVKRTYLYRVYG